MSGRREFGSLLLEFYSQCYCSNNLQCQGDLEGLITPIISVEENQQLIKILDGNEIWETLRMMKADKAPGPDGMRTRFYL